MCEACGGEICCFREWWQLLAVERVYRCIADAMKAETDSLATKMVNVLTEENPKVVAYGLQSQLGREPDLEGAGVASTVDGGTQATPAPRYISTIRK